MRSARGGSPSAEAKTLHAVVANVHQNLTPMRAASLSGNDCGGKDEATVVSRLQQPDRSAPPKKNATSDGSPFEISWSMQRC